MIIIDGDACPNISEIENIALMYKIDVTIVVDTEHNINSEYSNVIIVDKKNQSVDMKIFSICKENDIIITSDYGLAVICLGKKCKLINSSGMIITDHNIDNLMEIRHIKSKLRKSGTRLKGPKKRTQKDINNLIDNLKYLIERI